jgi:hypothetical protein
VFVKRVDVKDMVQDERQDDQLRSHSTRVSNRKFRCRTFTESPATNRIGANITWLKFSILLPSLRKQSQLRQSFSHLRSASCEQILVLKVNKMAYTSSNLASSACFSSCSASLLSASNFVLQ